MRRDATNLEFLAKRLQIRLPAEFRSGRIVGNSSAIGPSCPLSKSYPETVSQPSDPCRFIGPTRLRAAGRTDFPGCDEALGNEYSSLIEQLKKDARFRPSNWVT